MNNDDKFKLITRNLEETLTEEELKSLIESGTPLRHYIGFEISGKLHIGHFFQLMKVKDLQEAGVETQIFLADLHSAVNDKLGGDLETIKKIGKEYFIPAMKVLFECIGGDPEKLIFRLCSDDYKKYPEFWMTFIEMGKATTLARTKRSITIMGREEGDDSMETAKLMYPIMQAADIFMLQANIAQAGIDQRKVHVVARDGANQIKTFPLKDKNGNRIKPIAIHTPILLGLDADADKIAEIINREENKVGNNLDRDDVAMRIKMSKSKADSAISIHDSEEHIREKVNRGFAAPKEVEYNPILNWVRYLVFYDEKSSFVVTEDEKHGGQSTTYTSYSDLEEDYKNGKLYPLPLKKALADWLINKLAPAREYFEDPKRKQALEEITALTSK